MKRIEITPEFLAEQRLSNTFPQRLEEKIDKSEHPNGCHIWTGSKRWFKNHIDAHGHLWRGVRHANGSWNGLIYVHVAVWVLNYGPVPEGYQVQHNCPNRHNPLCCNIEHLKLGLPSENTKDMVSQGTDKFKKGHKFSPIGELNPSAELTQIQAEQIRLEYTGKTGEQNELGIKFGISQTGIWKLLMGYTYGFNNVPCAGMKARLRRIEDSKLPALPKPKVCGVTFQEAEEIRAKYTGKRGEQSQLAREYNTTQGTIWNVVNNVVHKKPEA